jgi:hypothetical protein
MNGQALGQTTDIVFPSNPKKELLTNSQISRLKALSERARSPESFDTSLTRSEAADRIGILTGILALTNEVPITEW